MASVFTVFAIEIIEMGRAENCCNSGTDSKHFVPLLISETDSSDLFFFFFLLISPSVQKHT